MAEESRYPALRTIAGIYRLLAYLAAFGAVVSGILAIAGLVGVGGAGSGAAGLLGAVYALFATITLLAISEGIRLFIDIEANTRGVRDAVREPVKLFPNSPG